MAPRIVTFASDFGWAYAAQVKGVLTRWVAPGRVVDLTHDLPRQAIAESAFLLRHMAAPFPPGTVHLAVVDPGVGGARAPVAIECTNGSRLVGPDNGLLVPLAEHFGLRRVVRLDRDRTAPGGPRSPTFDGRDLFGPAAGRLAAGHRLSALGPPTELAVRSIGPTHRPGTRGRGRVVHVDRFGNLVTDLPPTLLRGAPPAVRLRIGGRWRRVRVVRSYPNAARGDLLLLVSSFGTLEIAVREGSAADRLGVRSGETVHVDPTGRSPPRTRDRPN